MERVKCKDILYGCSMMYSRCVINTPPPHTHTLFSTRFLRNKIQNIQLVYQGTTVLGLGQLRKTKYEPRTIVVRTNNLVSKNELVFYTVGLGEGGRGSCSELVLGLWSRTTFFFLFGLPSNCSSAEKIFRMRGQQGCERAYVCLSPGFLRFQFQAFPTSSLFVSPPCLGLDVLQQLLFCFFKTLKYP